LAANDAPLPPDDARISSERLADFVIRRPPVRTLDCRNPFANYGFWLIDFIQTPSIGAEHLSLIGDGQFAFAHRLDGAPCVVTVVVINVGRPCADFPVKIRQIRWERLIPFEPAEAMLEKGFARQLLKWRELAAAAIKLVGFVAFVKQKTQP